MAEILEQRARQLAHDMGYQVEWGRWSYSTEQIFLIGYGVENQFRNWLEVIHFLEPEPKDEKPSEHNATDISYRFNSDCVRVKVFEYEDGIYLESIEVYPPDNRKAGHGTLTMKRLQAYCDAKMKPMYLYASDELGGDLEMLQKWYTKIGMKETIWGRFHGFKYDFMYAPITHCGDSRLNPKEQ